MNSCILQLKYFAMKQKITGEFDSTYSAHFHSLETLKDWHSQHSSASNILLSSQVLLPSISSVFMTLYFIYLLETEPNNLREKLDKHIECGSKEINREGKALVWIIVAISTLFTVCTIIADAVGLYEYNDLRKEIADYFNDDSRNEYGFLHTIPIIMLVYDLLSLLFIVFPFTVKCLRSCKCKLKVSFLVYSLLAPLTCITTHSYHIIFAFINNPYHATSVLLFYIMTLFVLVVVFHKIYYFVSVKIEQGQPLILLPLYFVTSVFIGIPLVLTVIILLILPITDAVDEASNQIYSIYQVTVTVFAALVTWKIVFRDTNSVFAVLIKAGDKLHSQDEESSDNERIIWKNLSEKEKEIELCIQFLKFYRAKQTTNTEPGTITSSSTEDDLSTVHRYLHQPLPDRQCHTIS